jgi:hypothetical protein
MGLPVQGNSLIVVLDLAPIGTYVCSKKFLNLNDVCKSPKKDDFFKYYLQSAVLDTNFRQRLRSVFNFAPMSEM